MRESEGEKSHETPDLTLGEQVPDVGVEEHPIGEREDLSNQCSQFDPLDEEGCELGSGDILEAGVESSVLAELQEEQGTEVVAEELGKDDFDRQWLAKETLLTIAKTSTGS